MTNYELLLLAIPILGTAGVVIAIEIASRLNPVARPHAKRK